MDPLPAPRSDPLPSNSLHFPPTLMPPPPQSSNSFSALLELPPNQALELLKTPDSHPSTQKPFFDANNLTFPTNAALIERAARFSVFAGNNSPETSNSVAPVKTEPPEVEAVASDPGAEGGSSQKGSAKRKEREKKTKGASKKSKKESSEEAEKLPYVHVRARRGQATDSHSLAERARREKINARMKLLQELVPGCSKISGTALVLDEIINHVQSLQRQVEFLSMRLAAVNPRIDFNLDSILAADSGSLGDCNFPGMVMPSPWPDVQVNGNRQQYQDQWNFDAVNQPVWGREEDGYNFITPENSLLSYDSSANSACRCSRQLKMEV